ncbi:hypothetical protein BDM02DRAFT_3109483 [Thelephora ganbajun]|uniref:Uncharacterized protein n=1 Tax=Thelephora ganbajun TaxID=370292 RepID=A0ACB6ZRM7_THEGA|nr:hypothetical protein BDM02DRAFT_3109483 [Thelephora ganbajun]
MRFSIFPPSSNLPPPQSERAASTWIPKPERSQLLSSIPSSINGYTFINFGQPVPTRLASHSFLHSLVKAGLPTKAASQAKLMMADGIRIHTKTMESILASTVDQSSYPPIQPLKVPLGKSRLDALSEYPIADTHTRIAVRLLEEARRRRQERTQRMYDVVINACLLQGEVIVASLLFIMLIKDWQLRQALKNQRANNPPPEPPETLTASSPHPTRQTHWSLLERIDHILTTRKDPQDPSFQNAIQALANLAFAVDTGQFPSRFMGSLIKALYSVPKSHAIVHVGSPNEVHAVNAYRYIHQVLMRLVGDATGKLDEQRDLVAGRKFNVHAFNALLHYCLRHRLSKAHASDLLEVMGEKWQGMTIPSVNLLFRGSTLLRDDTIRVDKRCSAHAVGSTPIAPLSARRAKLLSPRWAHIVNILKLELAVRYPSEPVIRIPATPDAYTVTGLITHLTATDRGHIIAEKLTEIIPELNLANEDGSRLPIEERGRCVVSYGPYFFTTILNALVKDGRTSRAGRVWRMAIEAEKASWVDKNEPWFLPIHAYTCMLQLCSKEGKVGKVTASLRRNSNGGIIGRTRSDTRVVSAMAMGKQVFRAVRVRCQFLETMKGRDDVLGLPPTLRKFTPDERYFNALLDLFGRRVLKYARPMKSHKSYWRWLEKVASDRFARNGATSVHWHPMLAEIVTEMHKYGYKVPEGLRFLLVGRISCVGVGGSEPLQPIRPGPFPPPRKNRHRIPVLKTRGLPIPRGKPRRRARRGV